MNVCSWCNAPEKHCSCKPITRTRHISRTKKIGCLLALVLAISPADRFEKISSTSVPLETREQTIDRMAQAKADRQSNNRVQGFVRNMQRLSPESRPDNWDGTLCKGPIFTDGPTITIDGTQLPIDYAILETSGERQMVLHPHSIGYGLYGLAGSDESGAVLVPNAPSTLTVYVNDGRRPVFADRYWLGIHDNCRIGDREYGRPVSDGILVTTG